MTEPTATAPLKQGTIARPTRAIRDLCNALPYDPTDRFEIEEFLTAGDASKGEIAVDFYYGNINGGFGNLALPADAVEEVISAEEANLRKPPSAEHILRQISDGMMDSFDGFETNEVVRNLDLGQARVYGKTDDGLEFGFEITISKVWKIDG